MSQYGAMGVLLDELEEESGSKLEVQAVLVLVLQKLLDMTHMWIEWLRFQVLKKN